LIEKFFSPPAKVLTVLPDALWRTAQDICEVLERARLPFCLIGGLALQRWGQPRATADVDVSLMADFARELEVVELLLNRYQARIEDAREFVQQHRVLLLASREGVALDVSFAAIPYEQRVFTRSITWKPDSQRQLRICSAEDLVVLKSMAGRPQDWIDVENIILRCDKSLDRQLILQELVELVELADDATALPQLQGLLERHS